jgi:peptidoglycan hydrolase-like protein with peptidoglycan-binding domain
MLYQESIASLVQAGVADQYLKKKSSARYSVRSLQVLLYKLGFGAELNWEKFRADGDYGGGTTRAVNAFLQKNNLRGNGEMVDTATAELMLDRYQLLPYIAQLQEATQRNQLAPYSHGTAEESALKGLQSILNALGYGQELQFQQYGAHGTFDAGTASAIQAFASGYRIISDGRKLTSDLARRMLEAILDLYGPGWQEAQQDHATSRRQSDLTITQGTNNNLFVHNEFLRARFKKHKLGLYTAGSEAPGQFIQTYTGALRNQGMTDSAIRVILPVSDHEGKLEGVNTWDNSFLSFGMFQWTLGTKSNAGELPALLKKLKDLDPGAFQEYFVNYGLDVHPDTNETTGYFTLNGSLANSSSAKEAFRKPEWAFRFWSAGLDPRVQIAEVIHAHSRIFSFYHRKGYTPLGKYYIDQLVTSEYGVSLLLDHHVNRPGHLMSYRSTRDVVGEAMRLSGLENTDPATWTTREEQLLLQHYIPLRAKYKMTHGQQRADNITRQMQAGNLSAERGSFLLKPKTRGLAISAFPAGKTEEDYPMVSHEEYENRAPAPDFGDE